MKLFNFFLGQWRNFYPGVKRCQLIKFSKHNAGVVLLKYDPGASVPGHYHQGREIIYVLSGSQEDESGTYCKGDLKINLPYTSHRVSSKEGCLVLVIYEKPVQFLEKEQE